MISFSVTPFTDLPAHRIIRSYFGKETSHDEELTTVDSELSRLWSEERRYEENRFTTMMAELDAISKELGVTTSVTPDPESTAATEECSTRQNTTVASTTPTDVVTYLGYIPPEGYTCKDLEAWYALEKTKEEQRQERWLYSMDIKVRTLLQEAHGVLGTSSVTAAGTDPSTSFQVLDSDHTGNDPFDVISLYMHEESSSFTTEGSTLLNDNDPFVASSKPKPHGNWLLDDDVLTDTADTSLSSNRYVATDKLGQPQDSDRRYKPKKKRRNMELERSTIRCYSIEEPPFPE